MGGRPLDRPTASDSRSESPVLARVSYSMLRENQLLVYFRPKSLSISKTGIRFLFQLFIRSTDLYVTGIQVNKKIISTSRHDVCLTTKQFYMV